jgi:flagellar basal-body rod modification protein FlgD
MDITSIASNAAGNAQGAAGTSKKNSLNQEDFLKLFMAQLKFQNPLEPMDNFQMATQLAQFNTVDALTRMNETMTQLAASQNSMNNVQVAGLIGKKVKTQGNGLAIQQGAASEGMYQLAKPGKTLVQIFDSQGTLVRLIDAGAKDTSLQRIAWDGKSQSGAILPDGTYTFKVMAVDSQGQSVSVTTYQTGTVDGVSLENGAVALQVNGGKVQFGDILSILN